MVGLLEFKEQRIVSLMGKVAELELENEKLRTLSFELMNEDVTDSYKDHVRKEVFQDAKS